MLKTSSQIHWLDLRELKCPMALLQAKKAMGELEKEQRLELKIADKASCDDILRYMKKSGYQLCEKITTDNEITLIIQKSQSTC